jgi:hypothetical protein
MQTTMTTMMTTTTMTTMTTMMTATMSGDDDVSLQFVSSVA